MRLDDWPCCRVATVDITPERRLPLAGYAFRGDAPASSVASALEANLLLTAVEGAPLLLVALDTLFGSEALREALASELDGTLPALTRERIQLIASHTHFAPSLDPLKPRLGAFDAGYFAACAERIGRAVRAALAEPACSAERFEAGRGRCTANVYRRLRTWIRERRSLRYRRAVAAAADPGVPIDHDVRVVRLADRDGRTLCLLWSWPCHAVSSDDPGAVSADFPGMVRGVLRELHGADLPVLYFPGFCGDIRPRSRRPRRSLKEWSAMPFARGFAPPGVATHADFAAALAAAVREADADRGAIGHGTADRAAGGSVSVGALPLTQLLAGLDRDDTRALERVSIRLPPLGFELWNAEMCAGHGPHRVVDGSFPSGCANGVFGYLPTDAQIAEGGYEVDGFAPLFALEGRYRHAVERRVRALADGHYDAVGGEP